MKKTIIITFLILLKSALTISFSQTFGGNGSKNFYGKWNAECAVSYKSTNEIEVCDFCLLEVDENDSSFLYISNIELIFLSDSLFISRGQKTYSVPYEINDNSHDLSFELDDKTYSFYVEYFNGNILLIEQGTGKAIVLNKKRRLQI